MPRGKYAPLSRKSRNTSKTLSSTTCPPPATADSMASQMEDTNPGLRDQSNFDALMQAITTCQTTLTGKIESMQLDISLIRRDMDCFRSRLTETERRLGEVEGGGGSGVPLFACPMGSCHNSLWGSCTPWFGWWCGVGGDGFGVTGSTLFFFLLSKFQW